MPAPVGRTYNVPIDSSIFELVTVLEDGNLVLEDAVDGHFTYVDRKNLSDYARSRPPYTDYVADCIRRELLSSTHDDCNWPYVQQSSGRWWYRTGKCPACGEW